MPLRVIGLLLALAGIAFALIARSFLGYFSSKSVNKATLAKEAL
jgi:hypothetical protein